MLVWIGLSLFSSFNVFDSVASTLDFLNKQSGVLTLSSILAAIAVFFYQQNNERRKFNERVHNACKALLTDLVQIEEFYSSSNENRTFLLENDIEYTDTSIGMEYYNSVVNSGLITYLDEETQVELSNFYYNIFLFNEWYREMNHFFFFSPLEESTRVTITNTMQQKLTKHEREIKLKLPIVKSLLDTEMQKLKKLT